MPATARWEHFPHGADIGVSGVGQTKVEAFQQAAIALTAVITDPGLVRPQEMIEIACQAPDDEMMLVAWLNALVYEMAVRHMLFSRFEVRMTSDRLEARCWGEPLDISRHQPVVEVKGATYTALEVRQEEDGLWHARCVVDV